MSERAPAYVHFSHLAEKGRNEPGGHRIVVCGSGCDEQSTLVPSDLTTREAGLITCPTCRVIVDLAIEDALLRTSIPLRLSDNRTVYHHGVVWQATGPRRDRFQCPGCEAECAALACKRAFPCIRKHSKEGGEG